MPFVYVKITVIIGALFFIYNSHASLAEKYGLYIPPSERLCAFSAFSSSDRDMDPIHREQLFISCYFDMNNTAKPSAPSVSAQSENSSCPELHNLTGEEFVQAVLETTRTCIGQSNRYAVNNKVLPSLFSENKLILIMRKFVELAEIYSEDNQNKIKNVTYFIRGAYHTRVYHSKILTDEIFTERVTEELHKGLKAYFNSLYFKNDPDLGMLFFVVRIVESSGQAVPYIDKLIYLLDNFSVNYPTTMRSVIYNGVFRIYQNYRNNSQDFIDHILDGNTLALEALIRFSRRDDLIDHWREGLLSAVSIIGQFLQYGNYPRVYDLALARLDEILKQHPMGSKGAFLRIPVSAAIIHWGDNSESPLKPDCRTYNVCSFQSEWKAFLFPPKYTYTCQATDLIKIKFMRDVPLLQQQGVCEDLIEVDRVFHETLQTDKQPVIDDHNTTLEIIVFSSGQAYDAYGEPIFGISPHLGGVYREGDPEVIDNIPQVFVFENGSEKNLRIPALKHEFVHYLDGRYNKYDIYGYGYEQRYLEWWTEGLAEYFSRGDYHISISDTLAVKKYQLSEVFSDSPRSNVKFYDYGYAAVKFLKENSFDIIEDLRLLLRDGSVDLTERVRAYNERIEEIGTSLDADFHIWIDDLVREWTEEGNPALDGYCESRTLNERGYASYISQVSLAGRTIADYRNQQHSFQNEDAPIDINSGSSYDLDITVGSLLDNLTYDVRVWVDWNKDKEFSDTEKVIDQEVSLSSPDELYTISQTLEAPASAEGSTRMRVVLSYSSVAASACSAYEYGETEDYALNVLSSPSLSVVRVNSLRGEVNSVLRVRKLNQTISLSEMFYTPDNRMLEYTANSSQPDQVQVQIEDGVLSIKSSEARTKPVRITVTARDSSSGRQYVKKFSVVFEPYTLPLVLSASDERRESFVRIINNSNQNGVVHITARDDSGIARPAISLSLTANGSAHFNSTHLKEGNPEKGLIGSLGTADGNWQLTLESGLDFHASTYIRLKGDGFITSMNELLEPNMKGEEYNYFAPIFNPASNQDQRSLLKLFNHNESSVSVRITGTDDWGHSQFVDLLLPVQSVKTISSMDLERGGADLTGAFGDGNGKWRLKISSSQALDVMNLMESPTGHLSNLSYSPLSSANTDGTLYKMLLPEQENRQGFVRIINHSNNEGEITITATDDLSRRYEPFTLSISAGQVKHFNAADLQNGNKTKGLPAIGLGEPQGMWMLKFESDLDIQVLSYMRSEDGFLTSLDSVLQMYGNKKYSAWFFNPASNQNQKSMLRFVNMDSEENAVVSISGVDDRGNASGEVFFTVPAGRTTTLNAQELETGNNSSLRGVLGAGKGKRRLSIKASRPLWIMNLMESPNGYISNLSIK